MLRTLRVGKRVKRLGFAVIAACALALTACGAGQSHTTALLTVRDKITEDGKTWITAYNAADSRNAESETWKIRVEDANAWNLIQPGGLYLTDFSHKAGKKPDKSGLIEAELDVIKPASAEAQP